MRRRTEGADRQGRFRRTRLDETIPLFRRALYRLTWPPLAFALALVALAGCSGTDQDSSAARSSQDLALVFLAGDGELTVVDVDAGRAEVRSRAIDKHLWFVEAHLQA